MDDPTDDRGRSRFDRMADAVSAFVARPTFFLGCVLLVAIWLPSLPLFPDATTWQLPINTITTVVTFLLVALLQNDQARFARATNARLQRLAELLGDGDPVSDEGQREDGVSS